MAVDEITYPLSLDRLSASPVSNTTIIKLGAGAEVRVANWDDLPLLFNAAHGLRSLRDLQTLLYFFRRRKGEARPFLVRDQIDYKVGLTNAGEAVFGTGDGATRVFQFKKNYVDAYNTDTRIIRKPQQGTVKIYVDGVLKTETTHYTINYSTGIVTFVTAPAGAAVLEWEGWFKVPVRFAIDRIPVEDFEGLLEQDSATGEWVINRAAGDIPTIPMVEVFET